MIIFKSSSICFKWKHARNLRRPPERIIQKKERTKEEREREGRERGICLGVFITQLGFKKSGASCFVTQTKAFFPTCLSFLIP